VKELIVFDLDGTLAESKSAIDAEMSTLLGALLGVARVAVISGGAMPQFEKQLVANLPKTGDLTRLSLLPTCGTRFY
jgi:phosphomannomutase